MKLKIRGKINVFVFGIVFAIAIVFGMVCNGIAKSLVYSTINTSLQYELYGGLYR